MPEMTLEWRSWIEENLTRGVPEQELIQILKEKEFEHFISYNMVMETASKQRGAGGLLSKSLPAFPKIDSFQSHDSQQVGSLPENKPYTLTMAMDQPIIRVYQNVLSAEECQELIELSRPKLKLSTTVSADTGEATPHEARTSQGCFFNLRENPLIQKVDERASELMNLPVEHGEGLQVLCYKQGAEYRPHFDFFPPEQPGSRVHLARGGQRVSTLIFYLNTVEAGGETIFPSAHLKVSPLQGTAVYFSYYDEHGNLDSLTLHGGTPVIQGVKWIATKWMRENTL